MSFRQLAVVLPLVLAACSSTSEVKEEQLENVAKDWCLTIRASQVLPVYPLTEDLQPGDVFVVQTPLTKQAEIYQARGFLPLDQHVTRLDIPLEEMQNFYRQGGNPISASAPFGDKQWTPKHAAFPTYNFQVERGAGLNLAIPIQGVPIGLGLMGTASAVGSVSIDDAVTYGIDIETMLYRLDKWLNTETMIEDEQGVPQRRYLVRETLEGVSSSSSSDVYLRVVNRVYLARSVTVSLQNLETRAASGQGGAARPVELPTLPADEVESTPEAAETAANATVASTTGILLKSIAPGGAVQFRQATQSAVTFQETFDSPLAIGYLGFDLKVYKDGSLSPPIPSFALLNDEVEWPEYVQESLLVPAGSSGQQLWELVTQALEQEGVESVEITLDEKQEPVLSSWSPIEK